MGNVKLPIMYVAGGECCTRLWNLNTYISPHAPTWWPCWGHQVYTCASQILNCLIWTMDFEAIKSSLLSPRQMKVLQMGSKADDVMFGTTEVLLFCPTIPSQWALHRCKSQSGIATFFLHTVYIEERMVNRHQKMKMSLQFERGNLSARKFVYGCQRYRFNTRRFSLQQPVHPGPYESVLPRSPQLPLELPWFTREGGHPSPTFFGPLVAQDSYIATGRTTWKSVPTPLSMSSQGTTSLHKPSKSGLPCMPAGD